MEDTTLNLITLGIEVENNTLSTSIEIHEDIYGVLLEGRDDAELMLILEKYNIAGFNKELFDLVKKKYAEQEGNKESEDAGNGK